MSCAYPHIPNVVALCLLAPCLWAGGCSQQARPDEGSRGESGLQRGRDVSSTTAGAATTDAQRPALTADAARPETPRPDYESQTAQVDEPLVSAEQYDAAFEAAQETLRRLGFLLERVDARAGVITTRPKTTGGLATLWHREQATLGAEFEDALHRQRRTVRIEFAPETPPTGQAPPSSVSPAAEAPTDVPASPTRLRVRVILERMNRPLHRIDTDSITSSTYAVDPYLPGRGTERDYAVPFAEDRELAQWIVDEIVDEAGLDPTPKK